MFGFEIYCEGNLIYVADAFYCGDTEAEAKDNARMVIEEDITEMSEYQGYGVEDFDIEIIEIEC